MSDKKEKVIHTRVPEALDEELRKRANNLGVSVSNLVRNALNHAFGLVGDVISDSAEVARSARGEGRVAPSATVAPTPGAPTGEARVLGWQPLILNLNAVCSRCNDVLFKGTQGAVAVTDRPADSRPFLCMTCLEELSHDDPSPHPSGHDEPAGRRQED